MRFAPQCTRQRISVNNGNAVPNEVMNAFSVMHELMIALQRLRQNIPVTKDSAHRHQVSYLAASGGDSKGVHHVSGSDWRRLSAIMDSGSVEHVDPESLAKSVPLMETEASRQGQTCHTADGGVTKNKGGKTVSE